MPSDKTVILVTGGNSGIGFETVQALSKQSEDFHILLGCRSVEKGQRALEEIRSTAGESLQGAISVVQIDVTDEKSIQAVKEHVDTQFGKLDVLINNAGIIFYHEADLLTNLRSTFECNVFGTMLLTEKLEPLLKRSHKPPYIVYVSSAQGSVTGRLDPTAEHRHVRGDTYRMSKAAMNMLAACHRYNFAEWGCKVLAFNPGLCVSNLTGEQGREMRVRLGARDPKDPAVALVDIVLGRRDDDIDKNGMVDLDGGILPW